MHSAMIGSRSRVLNGLAGYDRIHYTLSASVLLKNQYYKSMAMREPKRARTDATGRIALPNIAASSQERGNHYVARGRTTNVPGLTLTDHFFKVPLDYSDESRGDINLFVRVAMKQGHAESARLPSLLFLQGLCLASNDLSKGERVQKSLTALPGGPGFESPRPMDEEGWMKHACAKFRVFLLDQRGTGLSDAITTSTLLRQGDAQAQAEYLSHFRADNIIRDAEVVRKAMCQDTSSTCLWTLLGQSFGGFCAVHYLSAAPTSLAEVLLTGGIPPNIDEPCAAATAYTSLFRKVIAQNGKFYGRFPGDAEQVRRIVRFLIGQPEGGVKTPSGNSLSPRGLQSLGMQGLGSYGGMERLHYLLEKVWERPDEELSVQFLKALMSGCPGTQTPLYALLHKACYRKGFDSWLSWDTNPLYALLHEACYCNGGPSRWAAQRVMDTSFSEHFDAALAAANGRQVLFTGEMVFPWMFEEFAALQPVKEAAEILASKADWPKLYDLETLESNSVPVAGATYYEDMYVDFELAQASASHIKGIRQYITNEYMHSGLRDDGPHIFERLLGMTRSTIPMF